MLYLLCWWDLKLRKCGVKIKIVNFMMFLVKPGPLYWPIFDLALFRSLSDFINRITCDQSEHFLANVIGIGPLWKSIGNI